MCLLAQVGGSFRASLAPPMHRQTRDSFWLHLENTFALPLHSHHLHPGISIVMYEIRSCGSPHLMKTLGFCTALRVLSIGASTCVLEDIHRQLLGVEQELFR
jgi:hypothetical protein